MQSLEQKTLAVKFLLNLMLIMRAKCLNMIKNSNFKATKKLCNRVQGGVNENSFHTGGATLKKYLNSERWK